MSNNGINSATNGRSNSSSGGSSSSGSTNINLKTKSGVVGGGGGGGGGLSGTTSISQRNDVFAATKAFINKNTNATTNSKTLPDKITTTTTTTTASSAATATHNKIATHRRDNSSLGGIQKDARKFQYIAPQTNVPTPAAAAAASGAATDGQQSQQQADAEQLVYYDGKIHSATLSALIKHMVPTHDYCPEHNYIFAFLLSARLFIRTHELLAKISEIWEEQQQQTHDVVDECARYGYGGSAVLMINVNAVNSASPLTQRKNSVVGPIGGGGTTTTTRNAAELEPMPLQRTATQKSAQNCIRLLSEWIETFPYDFRDERLMQQVRILARKCVYIDNSLGKQVSRILQTLVGRLTALEHYEEFLQTLHASNVDLNPNASGGGSNIGSVSTGSGSGGYHNHGFQPLFVTSAAAAYSSSSSNNSTDHGKHAGGSNQLTNSTSSGSGNSASSTPQPDDVYGIMDICASCAHLAHQLTAIELERLSHIGPEEFVQAFAKEYQHSVTTAAGAAGNASHVMSSSLNDMKKTRNLESYVEWFNRLSYLTATEIVKYPKKKQRVRVIEYWIETARECFNIGNFNSLVAIIAGLNLAPIARLKKTWSKVPSAKFSVLEHQMDPTSNFNSYRSTLKAAMWRSEGATDERERIIIPFFSLFVKDLYFLNEGCSNRLPNNHINFEKCSQLAKQVMEFNEWKKVSCPYEKLPNVIAYLQHSAVLNENTLSMASFECEPPENHEEKDRYKTVKAETKQQLLQQLQEQQQQQKQHQQQ